MEESAKAESIKVVKESNWIKEILKKYG